MTTFNGQLDMENTSFDKLIVRKWADQAVLCLVKHGHIK